jgi:hypothetical protein
LSLLTVIMYSFFILSTCVTVCPTKLIHLNLEGQTYSCGGPTTNKM